MPSPPLPSRRTTLLGVLDIMGTLYAAAIFLGIFNTLVVIPVIYAERSVYYRERASGMYSSLAFSIAQGLAELPFLVVQAAIYCVIVYFMVHFEYTAAKFFWWVGLGGAGGGRGGAACSLRRRCRARRTAYLTTDLHRPAVLWMRACLACLPPLLPAPPACACVRSPPPPPHLPAPAPPPPKKNHLRRSSRTSRLQVGGGGHRDGWGFRERTMRGVLCA